MAYKALHLSFNLENLEINYLHLPASYNRRSISLCDMLKKRVKMTLEMRVSIALEENSGNTFVNHNGFLLLLKYVLIHFFLMSPCRSHE